MARKIVYRIMAKFLGCATEQVDTAETLADANYLLGEYSLAYGKQCVVWIKKGFEKVENSNGNSKTES